MRYGAPWVTGALVYGVTELGIPGSVIRATTGSGANGAGILYNDWDSSADDTKLFRAEILGGAPVGAFFFEDGRLLVPAGTASGTYTISYRLWVDGVDLGTSTAQVTIGTGGEVTISIQATGIPSSAAIGLPSLNFGFPIEFALVLSGIPSTTGLGAPALAFDVYVEPPVPGPFLGGTARIALTAEGQLVVLIP